MALTISQVNSAYLALLSHLAQDLEYAAASGFLV